MAASSPISSRSAIDPFSRSSTLTDLNALYQGFFPMHSPQAWLVSSKRRTMPSLLDPPGSPLDLLLPITRQLDNSQWNKRLSLLTHRYLREFGIAREDEIIEKAWRTLELFCVGEEATKSLQRFKSTFLHPSPPWRELQTRSLTLDRSRSLLSFPTFLDDTFNLSHSNLSSHSHSSDMDTLADTAAETNNQEQTKQRSSQRGSFQSPLGLRDEHTQVENLTGIIHPRYMTPTAASRAQLSTPEPRASTPPVTASTRKRKAWMVSAAKRVGIVPGTPRSKKEGRVYKHISPLKGATGKPEDKSAYEPTNNALNPLPNPPALNIKPLEPTKTETKHEMSEQSPKVPVKDTRERNQTEVCIPSEKPLPSLPIATVQGGSPIIRRSLIDAGEKPLRRSISPRPGRKVEQEWPVLRPSRPTTPNTPREMVHDGFFNQVGSSIGATCGPSVDHRHESETTATTRLAQRSGSQDAVAPVSQLGMTMPTVPASETTLEGLKSTKEYSTCLPDASGSLPAIATASTLGAGVSTERSLASEPAPRTGLSSGKKLLPAVVSNAPSSQDSARKRVSRLPKRPSAPGTVRISISPRRTGSGRSSPYNPAAAHVSHGPSTKHDHTPGNAGTPAERGRTHHAGHSMHHANAVPAEVPSLIAVKQSSKQGQRRGRRSTIPRPRHQPQPYQDAESESEIFIAKVSKKHDSSHCMTTDDKSDDGDLDTDEDHVDGQGNKLARTTHEAKGDVQEVQAGKNGRSKTEPVIEGVCATKAKSFTSPTYNESLDGEKPSSATSPSHQEGRSSANESASIADTSFDTSRRRRISEEPSNRVKRLSAIFPEHGPVLRISDSADRIIMGYGSEEDVDSDDTKARKRNSVPELRRSVVMKELRKSTEGMLNVRLPLSRNTTTGSLAKHEFKEQASGTWNVSGQNDVTSELQSVVKAEASRSEDPFSSCNEKTRVNSDDSGRKLDHDSPLDWPLKGSPEASTQLQPVPEYSSEEGTSWISPLQAPFTAMVSEPKSSSLIQDSQENRSATIQRYGSARKKSQPQIGHRLSRDGGSSPAIGNSQLQSTPSGVRSAVREATQFPPRTSSRANTPDISVRSRPPINHSWTRDIPNRFESAQPRRVSEDFSMPKSATVDPATWRNSIHKLKDDDKSKFSTPAVRDTGRVQLSSAKGMLSNIKGLFHKRSIETPTPSVSKGSAPGPREKHGTVAVNGSPYLNYHTRTLPAKYAGKQGPRTGASVIATPRDAFPQSIISRKPCPSVLDSDDFYQATDLAMRILDAARSEQDSLKRGRLMQLGQLMVETVNGARDAEKAMEEAKQAAARAEMHCMRTKKSVLELTRLVGGELSGN